MYQKYYTEALVLGGREQGESDRVFALFTKDFGLVRARASAVRTENSRMRYALQHYSHVQVGLVRGKRGWRLGGATVLGERMALEGTVTFARTARLVLRLVVGEERNEYLFAALSETHRAFSKNSQEAFSTIEIISVARILFALGYLSPEALHLPAPRPGKYIVYVIHCENDALYIGQTRDLGQRWDDHLNRRGSAYTKRFKPIRVVHFEEYETREEAVAREHWLKRGFGRKWIRRELKAGRTRQAGTTLFAHAAYTERDLAEAVAMREKLLSSINQAITESHL